MCPRFIALKCVIICHLGKGRDLCRVHWDLNQNNEHHLVKMGEVDVETNFHENRFNDGKCDSMGRLWAGK